MFRDWDDVYLLLGPAAGGLIGLLFVVATLTGRLDSGKASRGASIYLSPTVFHFGVVMALSAVAMAPRVPGQAEAAIVLTAAVLGLGYAGRVVWRLRRGEAPEAPHWSDLWCYGVAPSLAYAALAGSAMTAWVRPALAPYGIALFLLVLLLVGIRNA